MCVTLFLCLIYYTGIFNPPYILLNHKITCVNLKLILLVNFHNIHTNAYDWTMMVNIELSPVCQLIQPRLHECRWHNLGWEILKDLLLLLKKMSETHTCPLTSPNYFYTVPIVSLLPDHLTIKNKRAVFKCTLFSHGLCCRPFRLAELLPFVDINRHWGIISKCLTYSKAASDPFAYSLLRQQYKKVLVTVVNRLLRRDLYPSSGHNSSLDTENDYCLQRIS